MGILIRKLSVINICICMHYPHWRAQHLRRGPRQLVSVTNVEHFYVTFTFRIIVNSITRSVTVFLCIMCFLMTLAFSLERPSLQSGGSISLLWLVSSDKIRQRSAQGMCPGRRRSQQSPIDDSTRGSRTPKTTSIAKMPTQ